MARLRMPDWLNRFRPRRPARLDNPRLAQARTTTVRRWNQSSAWVVKYRAQIAVIADAMFTFVILPFWLGWAAVGVVLLAHAVTVGLVWHDPLWRHIKANQAFYTFVPGVIFAFVLAIITTSLKVLLVAMIFEAALSTYVYRNRIWRHVRKRKPYYTFGPGTLLILWLLFTGHWVWAILLAVIQIGAGVYVYRRELWRFFRRWPWKFIGIGAGVFSTIFFLFANWVFGLVYGGILLALGLSLKKIHVRWQNRPRRTSARRQSRLERRRARYEEGISAQRRTWRIVGTVLLLVAIPVSWWIFGQEHWLAALIATLVLIVLAVIWYVVSGHRTNPDWPLPWEVNVWRPKAPPTVEEIRQEGARYYILLHPLNILPTGWLSWIFVIVLTGWCIFLLPFWPWAHNETSIILTDLITILVVLISIGLRVAYYRVYKVRYHYAVYTVSQIIVHKGWWKATPKIYNREEWSTVEFEGPNALARAFNLDVGSFLVGTSSSDAGMHRVAHVAGMRELHRNLSEELGAERAADYDIQMRQLDELQRLNDTRDEEIASLRRLEERIITGGGFGGGGWDLDSQMQWEAFKAFRDPNVRLTAGEVDAWFGPGLAWRLRLPGAQPPPPPPPPADDSPTETIEGWDPATGTNDTIPLRLGDSEVRP